MRVIRGPDREPNPREDARREIHQMRLVLMQPVKAMQAVEMLLNNGYADETTALKIAGNIYDRTRA